MASIEKVKKKKSVSLDCETKKSHSTKPKKKKMKETTKTRTHASKKDKHSRAHASSGRHKVRNISELAKLVASGKVKIPQSLENYADDKLVLLDQLFTILTPNDIKGMLPDILKGLKTKQVKRLCYEQLQKMDTEMIKMIIRGEVDQRKLEPEEPGEEIDKTADIKTLAKEEIGSDEMAGATSGQGPSESTTEEQQTYDPHTSDISDSEDAASTPPSTLQQDAQLQTESTDNVEQCEYENDSDSEKGLDDTESSLSPRSSQAKEMLLRQKCLEAALKKRSAMNTSCENEKTIIVEDKEESLEEKLRQRALESMLKNRHKN